jgi:flavin-dependent dehydrogenase
MDLPHGGRVAVVGGGPAGSFASFFLLEVAHRTGLDVFLDIYEPKDFSKSGPLGCNMCGGIISESLVQLLATEGINLPEGVVQRGIESYVLHCDGQAVELKTPVEESRIAALHRGRGPKGCVDDTLRSADGFLLDLACKKGARHIPEKVKSLQYVGNGSIRVQTKEGTETLYDLVIGATGVNTASIKLFEDLGISFTPPETAKTFICEVFLGRDKVHEHLGNAMHVFLLDLPGMEFAAAIPKGDYVTLCMLGDKLEAETIDRFMTSPEVCSCLPFDWNIEKPSCRCAPKLNMGGAKNYYADRVVLVGDCGVSRLYKDGIGAAYRTAKACAVAAVFSGIGKSDFDRFFQKSCRKIVWDNRLGKLLFGGAVFFRNLRFLRQGMLRTVRLEQAGQGARPMSQVLWNTFTGSAPYQEIILRSMMPDFWLKFGWNCFCSLLFDSRKVKIATPPRR